MVCTGLHIELSFEAAHCRSFLTATKHALAISNFGSRRSDARELANRGHRPGQLAGVIPPRDDVIRIHRFLTGLWPCIIRSIFLPRFTAMEDSQRI